MSKEGSSSRIDTGSRFARCQPKDLLAPRVVRLYYIERSYKVLTSLSVSAVCFCFCVGFFLGGGGGRGFLGNSFEIAQQNFVKFCSYEGHAL